MYARPVGFKNMNGKCYETKKCIRTPTSLCKRTVCSNKYQTDPPNTHLKFGMLLVTIMFHTYQVRYQHLYQLTSSATINSLYIHVCVTRSKNPTVTKYG